MEHMQGEKMETCTYSVEMLRDTENLRLSRNSKQGQPDNSTKTQRVLFVKLCYHCCLVSFLDMLKVHFYIVYVCAFACMSVCAPCACPVPKEARSGH